MTQIAMSATSVAPMDSVKITAGVEPTLNAMQDTCAERMATVSGLAAPPIQTVSLEIFVEGTAYVRALLDA